MTRATVKKQLARALKALVSLGLLGLILHGIASREGLDVLGARLRELDLGIVLVALASQVVAMLLAVVRWQVLLRSQSVHLPFPRLLRSFLVGRFYGVFTPSTAGLDVYRAIDVGREIGDHPRSASVIFLEKCFGLLGLVWVTLLLVPFGVMKFFGNVGIVTALLVGLGATLGVVGLRKPEVLLPIITRLPERLQSRVSPLLDEVRALPISRGVAASALSLGIVAHFMTAAVYAAAGVALGVSASTADLLVVGNAIVLATLLPVSLGGVGVREGTSVLMLGTIGVPMSEAALVALLGYLAIQPSALVGGLLSMMGGGKGDTTKKALAKTAREDDDATHARVITSMP